MLQGFLIRLMGNFVAIMFVSYGFSGIKVSSLGDAVGAALILGLINAFIKPILFIITLPINLLTLGFFTLLINAFTLKLVDWFIPGFEVEGFLTALFGALTISVVSTAITFFATRGGEEDIHRW